MDYYQQAERRVPALGAYKPAGFWIRFLATLIDGILTAVLAWVIATLIRDGAYFNTYDMTSDGYGLTSPSESISNLIYTLVFIVIFTASRYKGSPGKLICRIQVVNTDMTQISFLKSLGRVFASILSGIIFMIGFMMAGWNREKKALHDMICQTRVVYRKN